MSPYGDKVIIDHIEVKHGSKIKFRIIPQEGGGSPIEVEVSIDATVVRAHQHAAGARKRPAKRDAPGPVADPSSPVADPTGSDEKGGRRRYRRRRSVAVVAG